MGCDIHVFFETRTDTGAWKPTWQPRPDPDYWWENILGRRVEDGSAQVLFFIVDPELAGAKLEEQFKAMPESEVIQRFGDDPLMNWQFPYPGCISHDHFTYNPIDHRDYGWFSYLTNVRGNNGLWPQRGLPKDCCKEIAREYERQAPDAHSMSWQMVSEILAMKVLKPFQQYKWLKEHVADPENTRMVYWYDN